MFWESHQEIAHSRKEGSRAKEMGWLSLGFCCSLYFWNHCTVNIVVTFPLVFSSVNQSVHSKHLLKPVCFIQTAFLNLLYHGIELFISDAWECLFFLFSRKLLHPISVMASRQTVDFQWGSYLQKIPLINVFHSCK